MIHGLPSLTAEFVCLVRAREARVDATVRILDDNRAVDLLSPGMAALARAPQGVVDRIFDWIVPGLATTLVCRQRFFDDHLLQQLALSGDDEVQQVIVLGAGLDTRALRFTAALRGRPLFEIDFPATSERKRKQLERLYGPWQDQQSGPLPHLEQVGCDFARESFADALLRSPRFAKGAKTVVLWEGVTMYLERAAVRRTLQDLASLVSSGSFVGIDFWFLIDGRKLGSTVRRILPQLLGVVGEPVLFSLHPEDAAAFLTSAGWQVVDGADPRSLATRCVKDGRRTAPSFHLVWART